MTTLASSSVTLKSSGQVSFIFGITPKPVPHISSNKGLLTIRVFHNTTVSNSALSLDTWRLA